MCLRFHAQPGADPGRLELVRDAWLVCQEPDCGRKYPIADDIPVMLIETGDKWIGTAVDDLPVPPPRVTRTANWATGSGETSPRSLHHLTRLSLPRSRTSSRSSGFLLDHPKQIEVPGDRRLGEDRGGLVEDLLAVVATRDVVEHQVSDAGLASQPGGLGRGEMAERRARFRVLPRCRSPRWPAGRRRRPRPPGYPRAPHRR